MKNQLEEIGALQSDRKQPPRRMGRKGQRNSQKKQHSGEKGAPEKEQP